MNKTHLIPRLHKRSEVVPLYLAGLGYPDHEVINNEFVGIIIEALKKCVDDQGFLTVKADIDCRFGDERQIVWARFEDMLQTKSHEDIVFNLINEIFGKIYSPFGGGHPSLDDPNFMTIPSLDPEEGTVIRWEGVHYEGVISCVFYKHEEINEEDEYNV